MKLYNVDHSPYATRVRIYLKTKGIEAEIMPPPMPLRTPEFREAFPLGKVPILVLDDGTEIAESTVIMDYLEELHPAPPLVPDTPLGRAHNGMLLRYADTHLGPALFQLFGEMFGPSSAEVQAQKFEALVGELDKLQRLLASLPPFTERGLETGDIALATNLRYIEDVAALLGRPGLLNDFPDAMAWLAWARGHEALAEGCDEMSAAFHAFLEAMRGGAGK